MMERTAVEIAADGTRLRVFHRRGQSAWEHPIDDLIYLDAGVVRPCPVCSKVMNHGRR